MMNHHYQPLNRHVHLAIGFLQCIRPQHTLCCAVVLVDLVANQCFICLDFKCGCRDTPMTAHCFCDILMSLLLVI